MNLTVRYGSLPIPTPSRTERNSPTLTQPSSPPYWPSGSYHRSDLIPGTTSTSYPKQLVSTAPIYLSRLRLRGLLLNVSPPQPPLPVLRAGQVNQPGWLFRLPFSPIPQPRSPHGVPIRPYHWWLRRRMETGWGYYQGREQENKRPSGPSLDLVLHRLHRLHKLHKLCNIGLNLHG